jgi:shikimate dehydrogenase
VSRAVRGSTRVAGIIGDPVAHSRSPSIHNAAFAALGLDWVFVAFPVRAGDGERAIRAMPALHIAGLNVTMPHKTDAVRACDALSARAAALQSVNTVVLRDVGLFGDSTDGEGFVRALRAEGREPAGRSCAVLGAGGAARAIVQALGEAGGEVRVVARRLDAARAAAMLAPGASATTFDDVDEVVGTADIVVNATPVGMRGEEVPFHADVLSAGQFVLDTVYHPAETPLLAAARARGVPCANGLGMLVHQAALAFELWTGETAPLAVMLDAARADDS